MLLIHTHIIFCRSTSSSSSSSSWLSWGLRVEWVAPVCLQVMVLVPNSGSCAWAWVLFLRLVPRFASQVWFLGLFNSCRRSREKCDEDQPSTPIKDGWNKTSSWFCSVFKGWFVLVLVYCWRATLCQRHTSVVIHSDKWIEQPWSKWPPTTSLLPRPAAPESTEQVLSPGERLSEYLL